MESLLASVSHAIQAKWAPSAPTKMSGVGKDILSSGITRESFPRSFWAHNAAAPFKDKYLAVLESASESVVILDTQHLLKLMRLSIKLPAAADSAKGGGSQLPSPVSKMIWIGSSLLYVQKACGVSLVVATHLVDDDGPTCDDDDDDDGDEAPPQSEVQQLCRASDACGICFSGKSHYFFQLGRDCTVRCYGAAREPLAMPVSLLSEVVHVPMATRISVTQRVMVLVGPACAHVFAVDSNAISQPPPLLREVLFGTLVTPICVEPAAGDSTLILFFRQPMEDDALSGDDKAEGRQEVDLPPLNCVDRRPNKVSWSLLSQLVLERTAIPENDGQSVLPEGILIDSGSSMAATPVKVQSTKGKEDFDWRHLSLIRWGYDGVYAVQSNKSAVFYLRMVRRSLSIELVLEQCSDASASGATRSIADVLLIDHASHDAACERPVCVLVGERTSLALNKPGKAHQHQAEQQHPVAPVNGFADDPSRLFFNLVNCLMEPCLLQVINETDDKLGKEPLGEAAIRRIVEDVVRRENAKLLQAIESLLLAREK